MDCFQIAIRTSQEFRRSHQFADDDMCIARVCAGLTSNSAIYQCGGFIKSILYQSLSSCILAVGLVTDLIRPSHHSPPHQRAERLSSHPPHL